MPVGSSGGGSASAVRAGGAFVELSVKDRMGAALTKAQAKLAAFGAFASKMGSSALKAGAVLLAPMAALFSGTLERSKEGVFGAQSQQHAKEFELSWGRAILALQEGLVPVLEFITPILTTISLLARDNKGVVLIIVGVGVGLLALGLALKGFAVVTGVVALAIGAVKLVMLALSSPFIVIAALVIGLIAAFTNWRGLFSKLGETGRQAIGGIVAAIKSGQIKLAFKIAMTGLKLAWHDIVDFMRTELGGLVSVIGNIAKMVVILKAVQTGASIGSLFGPLGTFIGGALGGGAAALAVNEIDKAVEALLPSTDPATRAKLAAELAALIAKAKGGGGGGPPQLSIEAAKGLFSSPNFGRALAFGDTVAQKSLAIQERMAEGIDKIVDNTNNRAVFA